MDSCVRKKRTLAERREADKLRQRRFRAKQREEARLSQTTSTGPVGKGKKERFPKKTVEEIRATNRLRQQRFRARRRGERVEKSMVPPVKEVMVKMEALKAVKEEVVEDPIERIHRIFLEAATDKKNRQTEIRREKDRIRKRRQRQRKRDNALKMAGFSPEKISEHQCQKTLEFLVKDMEKMHEESMAPEDGGIEEEEEGKVDEEYFDPIDVMAQLEAMGLVLQPGTDGTPVLELKQKSEDLEVSEESTSSTPDPLLYTFPEKKPWQRCHSAEERRERERMRKRMYRAKQRFISTGKMKMQWDPALINRSPTGDDDEGIAPLPPRNKSTSQEQKLEAHRIYNRRYRERLRKDMSSSTSSPIVEESDSMDPDVINAMLFSTMASASQLSSILGSE
ncbi:hypothetical protein CAEBREN_09313 [Caenorhabditis brenneri]|uniref:Uncharacterized protein n=1 Tax=Caenorhabditis brenneri TaxID=135651 RepID=G0NGJ3_CAEBE|nr:hypothetical protein CAEBREN_09313 [Caenorhabditis brenneri]